MKRAELDDAGRAPGNRCDEHYGSTARRASSDRQDELGVSSARDAERQLDEALRRYAATTWPRRTTYA